MGARAVKLSADPHEQISPYHICSSPGQDAAGDTGLTPEAQLPAQELGGSPLFNLLPVKDVGAPLKVDYQKHMIRLSLQRRWFSPGINMAHGYGLCAYLIKTD